MKKLLITSVILYFFFSLSACSSDEGADNAGVKTIMLLVLIGFIWLIMSGVNKGAKQLKEKEAAGKKFSSLFFEALEVNGYRASTNMVTPVEYGLAIADARNSIGIYTSKGEFFTYPKEKIVSCEKEINYTEIVTNKTKAPIVSWNTTGVTKGEITKNFSHAFLLITVSDNNHPFWKLRVPKLEDADNFHALINSMIRNNTMTVSNQLNADRLIKLSELFEKGLLTQEEFMQQKQALLQSN